MSEERGWSEGTEEQKKGKGLEDEGEGRGEGAEEKAGGQEEEEATRGWSPTETGRAEGAPPLSGGGRRRRGRRLVKKTARRAPMTGPQRLLVLDTWRRSGLPAGDFAPLVGISKHTLYAWKKRFQEGGPAGLEDRPKGARRGSRLPEATRRAILMLKEDHPEWGCRRISDELDRAAGMGASAGAIGRLLHEEGYELEEMPVAKRRAKQRRFERARPNQMWQSDLFTFVLKRQNRRVHLVGLMDDHSRFLVGWGLHATAGTALVIEVVRAAVASWQAPEELLTDQGPQYVSWRGRSAFQKEPEARGIRHLVARAKRPQTLGKIERFWGTLWRECLERAVFLDLEDARRRIGLFLDYYNFQRPHQGIEGLVPADRYFRAAPEVLASLKARVRDNAKALALNGAPREPFYLTGRVGDQAFSVHAQGERVILRKEGEEAREIELGEALGLSPQAAPQDEVGHEEPPEPGTSAIDEIVRPGESR